MKRIFVIRSATTSRSEVARVIGEDNCKVLEKLAEIAEELHKSIAIDQDGSVVMTEDLDSYYQYTRLLISNNAVVAIASDRKRMIIRIFNLGRLQKLDLKKSIAEIVFS